MRTRSFSTVIPVFFLLRLPPPPALHHHSFFILALSTLVGTALWLRWSRRICSPLGSNKSAPHVPAPTPHRFPLSPPSNRCTRAPFSSARSPSPIRHPRIRACVSPRFTLLDHVRMSSPTALTRFTLERLLCRGTRQRNTHVHTACPGAIIAADSSRRFFGRFW